MIRRGVMILVFFLAVALLSAATSHLSGAYQRGRRDQLHKDCRIAGVTLQDLADRGYLDADEGGQRIGQAFVKAICPQVSR